MYKMVAYKKQWVQFKHLRINLPDIKQNKLCNKELRKYQIAFSKTTQLENTDFSHLITQVRPYVRCFSENKKISYVNSDIFPRPRNSLLIKIIWTDAMWINSFKFQCKENISNNFDRKVLRGGFNFLLMNQPCFNSEIKKRCSKTILCILRLCDNCAFTKLIFLLFVDSFMK